MTAKNWPSFLYEEGVYDAEQIDLGLLRGFLPIRVRLSQLRTSIWLLMSHSVRGGSSVALLRVLRNLTQALRSSLPHETTEGSMDPRLLRR